jgi:nanoRNase/pAp phosphatase (c-di-AMP/oligoRNAs hydrolase)
MISKRDEIQKSEFLNNDEKERTVDNIIRVLDEYDNFLLVGHKYPDEDCISSMVAFGLLISKMNKTVHIALSGKIQDNFSYLLSICKYNSIQLISGISDIPEKISVVVSLDTPKPSMIDDYGYLNDIIYNSDVLRVELDHHLEADARYFGDKDYCLVSAASSTCELIGLLSLKLEKNTAFLEKYQIRELFTRNLVLSIITGIISDSRMGKYLKSPEEKWFYNYFSNLFDEMLTQKTHTGSKNLTSKEEVFQAIEALSHNEEKCSDFLLKRRKNEKYIDTIIINQEESDELNRLYGNDIFVSVTKTLTNKLAEENGFLGLVVFYDDPAVSNLVQFRMRRSQAYQKIDLRDVLLQNKIENGGGHPGAVGFRFEKESIDDIFGFSKKLIENISLEVKKTQDA